jgi:sugar phosphate isomerase/epimerase
MSENRFGEGEVSRRTLLAASAALIAGRALGAEEKRSASKLKIAIFSKHLRFLEGEELAKGAAEIGFDGIDLAVRKGGHIEPDRVKQDLPKLAGIIREHGLEVPMITTDIVDIESPCTEDILRTMDQLGIRNYRWGGFKYNNDRPLAKQIDDFKPRVEKLAGLNARYRACAMYHTHSGIGLVGSSIWDLHEILTGFDPNAVGMNYDIGHATIEGGSGGWMNSLRIAGPYLRGVAVKDFVWAKDSKGSWKAQWVPLGEGMVRFSQFLPMLAQARFSGPLQMHFEYPLDGGRDETFATMKRDLRQLRTWLIAAGLA